MTSEDERRRSERKKAAWPVNIRVDDQIVTGETVDVSIDGMYINADDPVPLNETLTMTITPPTQDLIAVTAKVVWSDLDAIDTENPENRVVGIGLCFVEISEEDLQKFETAYDDHTE